MSKDNEDSAPESLSDAERLQVLEKSAKLNRWLLYGVAGAVLLMLLGLLTVQVVGLFADDPSKVAVEQISQLQKQVAVLKLRSASYRPMCKSRTHNWRCSRPAT